MSPASTVFEGLRDNPRRIALVVRTTLITLVGLPLILSLSSGLLAQVSSRLPIASPREFTLSALFLIALTVGLGTEFTWYRVASVVNLAAYTSYLVWLVTIPWEHPFLALWFAASALFVVLLGFLYVITAPSKLARSDAA